jgi:FkbM family methyltransferase
MILPQGSAVGIVTHLRRASPRLWFFFEFLRYKYLIGEREILFLHDFVPRGEKMAIDVGSSIGLYSRALANLVPKVVSFEANPAVATFAKAVAPGNVDVINIALSSAAKRTTLRVPVNKRGHTMDDLGTIDEKIDFDGKFTAVEILSEPLDAFDFTHCGFIKIDVEGHEEDVLEGAKNLIGRSRPVLMIELEERHNPGTVDRVTQWLCQLGYGGYFLSQGKWLPITKFRVQSDQDWRTVSKVPPRHRRTVHYIGNFVFVPVEARPLALRGGED